MQTSSTFFLLANFLAISLASTVSAIGAPPSEARLEAPLQINITNLKKDILSANRGSGRIDLDWRLNEPIAWRGSGRFQLAPEYRDNHQAEAKLAWRGSGRLEFKLGNNDSNQVAPKFAWRGSGRLNPNQEGVEINT